MLLKSFQMDEALSNYDVTLLQRCRRIARELIGRYGWKLLAEDNLMEALLKRVQKEIPQAELRQLAFNEYSQALYQACRQSEDTAQREQGYRELFDYLLGSAYNRWPELAEDVTQRALILVYEQIERCQEPGAFLAFAMFKLLQAAKEEQRDKDKNPIAPDRTDGGTALLESHIELETCLQAIMEAIERLNKRQQKVIRWKYIDELSDKEIADRLQLTSNHVCVLRHRAIRKLLPFLQADKRCEGIWD